jgi:hypothetical protein
MNDNLTECVGAAESGKPDAFIVTPIRPDRLGELYADGLVDDAQFRAGRKWHATYSGLWSGFWSDTGAPRTLQFWNELQHMDKVIGPVGASLFRDVLDKGYSIEMASAMRREGRRLGAKGWRRVFCACLTKLADATSH